MTLPYTSAFGGGGGEGEPNKTSKETTNKQIKEKTKPQTQKHSQVDF